MKSYATKTAAILCLGLLATASGCIGRSSEDRAREAAADIEASITDYDGPALNQKVDASVVEEVQRNLTAINEYMGEVDGKIDPVLVNSIQAFQRQQNAAIPWWQFWQRNPADGLITDELRAELAAATS